MCSYYSPSTLGTMVKTEEMKRGKGSHFLCLWLFDLMLLQSSPVSIVRPTKLFPSPEAWGRLGGRRGGITPLWTQITNCQGREGGICQCRSRLLISGVGGECHFALAGYSADALTVHSECYFLRAISFLQKIKRFFCDVVCREFSRRRPPMGGRKYSPEYTWYI